MNLFVTGTDTGIGKTVVSTILCLKLQCRYWKPIQSGSLEGTDATWVADRIGKGRIHPEVYCLKEPLSPHLAAAKENETIDIPKILRAEPQIHQTIIEGAGGLFVPLNGKNLTIDLMKSLKAKTLLVTRSGLGTINHTLLSLEAMRGRGIEPIGVVMVGDINFHNKIAIENFGLIKVIGEIPKLPSLDRQTLLAAGALIQIERKMNGHENDTENTHG